jgi:hypothetical protein
MGSDSAGDGAWQLTEQPVVFVRCSAHSNQPDTPRTVSWQP